MLNKLKSKWFWIILVIIIIVAVVLFNVLKKEESNYVTEKAMISDIIQTVEVTGSVESADDIDLNFNKTGTLQAVLVKAGDQVVKGQTLARLSASNEASQVADARASVEIAKLELEQLLAGASNQDVEVTKQELASAKANYQTTMDALYNLEQTRDQEIANIKSETINTLKDKLSIAQFSLDLIYDIIEDPEADNYLYVSDIVLLNNTKWGYQSINSKFSDIDSVIDQASASNDKNDILSAADSLENYLEDVLALLTDTYDIMVVTVNNSVYTTTVVDAFKTSINTKTASVNTAISAIQTDSANLRIRDLYYQTQISEKQNSVDSYKIAMDLAQAKLNFKTAPPRDFEISSAEANIKRAQATLNRYLSNWSETVITAPVDGIITEVNFDVGEQTSMSGSVVSMIGLATMQIEVDVPESDVTKLAVSDQVEISLDAFSSDEKFIGTVTFIDPAATNIDGVVYYTTKVSFNEKDERIKSGMTADLTIATDSKEGVLVVPSRAVIYRAGKKYVQIYNGSNLSELEVTTGLRGDGGLTEILTGLEEGVDVVTFIKKDE
ncbi:MAG: efflux RND transporter periplasmic adaptor subunit [Candidatus Komeilibacteria bacterium]|jgi:HlyD family secretion protein|nr:efflux RND transporter periplasmic adaptor subunit [Candidatus Komeilibacteria bacterium]